LGFGDRGRQVGEPNVADDHQVNIAGRMLLRSRHRAVDESPSYAIRQRLQRVAYNVRQSHCLQGEPLKLLEDGRLRGGLKVNVLALTLLNKDSAPDQGSQLALETRRCEAQVSGELPHIPPALRLAEGGCENRLPSLGEQSVNGW